MFVFKRSIFSNWVKQEINFVQGNLQTINLKILSPEAKTNCPHFTSINLKIPWKYHQLDSPTRLLLLRRLITSTIDNHLLIDLIIIDDRKSDNCNYSASSKSEYWLIKDNPSDKKLMINNKSPRNSCSDNLALDHEETELLNKRYESGIIKYWFHK